MITMNSEEAKELIRAVDILTERSINESKVNEHIQKQNEMLFAKHDSLSTKLDTILSQISQNSIENKEEHMGLKVSLKNKVNNTMLELRKCHEEDLQAVKEDVIGLQGNIMIKLGQSKKLLMVIGLVILIAFWQNIDGIMNKIAKDQGIELREKSPAVIKETDIHEHIPEVTNIEN